MSLPPENPAALPLPPSPPKPSDAALNGRGAAKLGAGGGEKLGSGGAENEAAAGAGAGANAGGGGGAKAGAGAPPANAESAAGRSNVLPPAGPRIAFRSLPARSDRCVGACV